MRADHRCVWALLAVAALGTGCGGRGDSGPETATIRGAIEERPGAHAASSPVTVLALDDAGDALAMAQTRDVFALTVPTGRDYLLVFSDFRGVIGAMVHGAAGKERPDFVVPEGTAAVDAGRVDLDRRGRSVRAGTHARLLGTGHVRGIDTDGDGIPDGLDGDDDNDGVPDALDRSPTGRDLSLDHDNDGVADDVDQDLDGDGIANAADRYPRDVDNDGEDDDREADDPDGPLDQPRGARLLCGDPGAGKSVILTVGCGACHGPEGLDDAARVQSHFAPARRLGTGQSGPRPTRLPCSWAS